MSLAAPITYRKPSDDPGSPAKKTWDDYYDGLKEEAKVVARLQDLELNLGPDLVQELEEESANAGGEQYRPKASATACKSQLRERPDCADPCLHLSSIQREGSHRTL